MSDLDECRSYRLSAARLNDCHDNASCDNQHGYYDCVCNIDFKDNSTDRDYLGRYCVGRSGMTVFLLTEEKLLNFFCYLTYFALQMHFSVLRSVLPLHLAVV